MNPSVKGALELLKQRIEQRIVMNLRTAASHPERSVMHACDSRVEAYRLVLYEILKVTEEVTEPHERSPGQLGIWFVDWVEKHGIKMTGTAAEELLAFMQGQPAPKQAQPEALFPLSKLSRQSKLAPPGWTCPWCKSFNDETSLRHDICSFCTRSPT